MIQDGDQSWEAWSSADEQVDDRSLFEIGSITKAFTGVLLADMSLRGEVDLGDPLSRHLRGPRPSWRHREPTLLELATHRSALPNVPRPMRRGELRYALGFGDEDPWASVTRAEYEALVTAESPRARPGGRMRYSSMAVGLLGDALAARAGKPYAELLEERIFEPLEMSATAVTVAPAWSAKLLQGRSPAGAAGSLRSNTRDMLRFLAACLSPPSSPLGSALTLAQQPHARLGMRLEVGLGWLISNRPRHPRVVWHNGGTWGFRSFAGLAPDAGTAAVVMSNTGRSVDRLGLRLVSKAPRSG